MDFTAIPSIAEHLSGGDLLVACIALVVCYFIKSYYGNAQRVQLHADRELMHDFMACSKERDARLMSFFKIVTSGSSEECTKEQAHSVILHTFRVSQYEIREFCRNILHTENVSKEVSTASITDCIANRFQSDVSTCDIFSYRQSKISKVIRDSWKEAVTITCLKIVVDERNGGALDTYLQQAFDGYIMDAKSTLDRNAKTSGEYDVSSRSNRLAVVG